MSMKKKQPSAQAVDTKKIVEEWGFQDEATKKALEFRINKEKNRKKKSQHLTAEERYQQFLKANKKPS
jgi:hypothetical protein